VHLIEVYLKLRETSKNYVLFIFNVVLLYSDFHFSDRMFMSNNNLLLTTPGVDYATTDANARVVNLPADDLFVHAVSQIVSYVRDHGTIDKLTLYGHGYSKGISSLEAPTKEGQEMSLPDFLDVLKIAQDKLGTRIAKEIDFEACATLTDLSPADVKSFRGAAKYLDAKITGALVNMTGDYTASPVLKPSGLRATFNPDGSVTNGPSDATFMNRVKVLFDNKGEGEYFHALRSTLRAITYSDADLEKVSGSEWFECHKDKPQEEGAACQTGALPPSRKESRDINKIKPADSGDTVAVKGADAGAVKPKNLGLQHGI
jgi:hypothetical protein